MTQEDVQKELEAIHGKMDGLLSEADAMQYKGHISAVATPMRMSAQP